MKREKSTREKQIFPSIFTKILPVKLKKVHVKKTKESAREGVKVPAKSQISARANNFATRSKKQKK